MGKWNNFVVEVSGGIALLKINRPQVMNALNGECWDELVKLVDYFEYSDDVKIIVVTGEGGKAFAAGADLNALKVKTGAEGVRRSTAKETLMKIEGSDKLYIAAVNGLAMGGGFELALTCDIRIASTNASFGFPETSLGIMPGLGGTQRLVRVAGVGKAKEIILAGAILSAQEAQTANIVMTVTEPCQLEAAAFKTANQIIKRGPLAIALSKRVINAAMSADLKSGLDMETLAFSVLLETEDKQEGVTAFLEKRRPDFKGQ